MVKLEIKYDFKEEERSYFGKKSLNCQGMSTPALVIEGDIRHSVY